jgi:hypothetical protein
MNTMVNCLERDVSDIKMGTIACALGCAVVKVQAMDIPFARIERASGLF